MVRDHDRDPFLYSEDQVVTLGELDRRVNRAASGVVADIYVFGGAAMVLAYDSCRATRDFDALFKPHGIVLEEAQAVAAELGLPTWWLNEQASSYVAPGGDPSASRVFDHPGLRVFAASPEHLLAMEALAARPRDAYDIRQLAEMLNLHTVPDVLALVREVFPEEERQPGSGSSLRISSARATERPARTLKTRCVPLRGRTLVDVPSASIHRLNSGSDLDELAAC